MGNKNRELAIRALLNMKGDDAYRARAAFSGFTPEQMQEQHGQSGMTRAQILAEYEAYDANVDAAVTWIESHDMLVSALKRFANLDRSVASDLWAIRTDFCEQARAALTAAGEGYE